MSHTHELTTVEHLDLQRYLGTWYEIARKPMWAEDTAASDITATYSLNEDGSVKVLNRCFDEDGEFEDSEGRATPVDGDNARLEVSFMPQGLRWVPFTKGDYWVMKLDPGYNFSLVGTPDRKYLWLLARDAHPAEATVQEYLQHAASQGFDLSDLIRPAQSGRVPADPDAAQG